MQLDSHSQFVLAGFFGAVRRYFDGEEEDEYFLNAVHRVVKEHGELMVEVLSIIDGYIHGSGSDRLRSLTGPFADLTLRAPSDYEEKASTFASLVHAEPSPKTAPFLITPMGFAYEIGAEGVRPATKQQVGGSVSGSARERAQAIKRGVVRLTKKPKRLGEQAQRKGDDPIARDGGNGDEDIPCPRIAAYIESVTVTTKTIGPTGTRAGKDDVQVTYKSMGEVGQPVDGKWPTVVESHPVEASSRPIVMNQILGSFSGGRNCFAWMAASVHCWEVDEGSVDQNLRKTAAALVPVVQAMAAATSVPVALGSAPQAGLLESIFNALLDLLGLSNDWMGSMNFYLAGKLEMTKWMRQLQWGPAFGSQNGGESVGPAVPGVSTPAPATPAPGTQTQNNQQNQAGLVMTNPTQPLARLKQTFDSHGGVWTLRVQVQMHPG